MKKIYFFIFLQALIFNLPSFGQAGTWTWISGSKTDDTSAVFGTQGVPSVSNHPYSEYEAVDWKDKQGNFWLFGGTLFYYSDMWKYNPVTNEWTWMQGKGVEYQPPVYGVKGVANSSNTPGNRSFCAASWVDTSGNFWLFGGANDSNYNAYMKRDLWKYDVGANEWTWVAGDSSVNQGGVHGVQGVASASVTPGSRTEACSAWTDSSNNLWLYGGYGYDEQDSLGCLDDMMKYNISTGEWTWMKGSVLNNVPPNFGTKGIANVNNDPGGRFSYVKWKDLKNNFWIFGGGGGGASLLGPVDLYNDVWKYDISLNEWTWMSGPNTANDTGNYQAHCTFDTLYYPSSRFEQRSSVTDNSGRFWTFGGNGSGPMNDLWVFDPQKLEWNLVSGNNLTGQFGSYGTLGVASPSNMPPSRMGGVAWWGNDNKFYLFGGQYTAFIAPVVYADVWVFDPDTNCVPAVVLAPIADFQSSSTTICANSCVNFTNLSTNATSWQWSFAGASDSTSSVQNPQNICYITPGIYNVTLIASNATGSDSVTFTNYINVKVAPPTPVITQVGTTLYCSTDTSYKSYQWYDSTSIIPGATDTSLVITHGGNYNVRVTNKDSCQTAVGITVIIGIRNYIDDNIISLSPNPACSELNIKNRELKIKIIEIYNVLGQEIFSQLSQNGNSNSETSVDVSSFPSGIYFLRLVTESGMWVGKFVKE